MTQFRQFELEIGELKRSLAAMGDLVDRAVGLAAAGILAPTADLRERSRALEDQTDAMESAIEDRCHTIIALQTPMVRDLRFVIAAMSITSDLERIGDQAHAVAKRAHYIACHQAVDLPPELTELGRLAQATLRQAMEVFVSGNLEATRAVIRDEAASDRMTKACYAFIQERMAAQPERIREYTHLLRAVAALEEIADTTVAIAEEALYIHKAVMIRHHHEELDKPG
jgi:phosphate transport system protein